MYLIRFSMNFSLTFIKLYSTMNLLHNPVKINEFLANQKIRFSYLLGLSGLEPPTSRLSGARSNQLSYKPAAVPQPNSSFLQLIFFFNSRPWSLCVLPSSPFPDGDDGIRTHDPLLAGQVLSQLSYTPMFGPLYLSMNYRSLKIEQQYLLTRLLSEDLRVLVLCSSP